MPGRPRAGSHRVQRHRDGDTPKLPTEISSAASVASAPPSECPTTAMFVAPLALTAAARLAHARSKRGERVEEPEWICTSGCEGHGVILDASSRRSSCNTQEKTRQSAGQEQQPQQPQQAAAPQHTRRGRMATVPRYAPRPGGEMIGSLKYATYPDVSVFASLTTATTSPGTLPHGLQDPARICVWSVRTRWRRTRELQGPGSGRSLPQTKRRRARDGEPEPPTARRPASVLWASATGTGRRGTPGRRASGCPLSGRASTGERTGANRRVREWGNPWLKRGR